MLGVVAVAPGAAICLDVVVGEERAVLALPISGDLLDPAGDAGVCAGALAAREAFVGDVAREDVAEGELLLTDHRRADA